MRPFSVKEINSSLLLEFNERLGPLGFTSAFLSEDHAPPWADANLYLRGEICNWKFQANIHIRAEGKANHDYAILIRDFLRVHNFPAKAYENLKITLVKYVSGDIEAYCETKDPICDLIMNEAINWASKISWSVNSSK